MPVFNPPAGPLATYHEVTYPVGDGEGAAGDPVTVSTNSDDETNAAATKNDFWGEPTALVAPAAITTAYNLLGLSLTTVTVAQALRLAVYRVVNSTAATPDGGNAWDEAATVLTLNSAAAAAKFVATDLVWISSSDYKPHGEILKVASQTGATVTLARETVNAGGDNTGLRWAHATNIGAGTLKIYRCYRVASTDEHPMEFDFSASTAFDHRTLRMRTARSLLANDGLIIRAQNATGDTTSTLGAAILYYI